MNKLLLVPFLLGFVSPGDGDIIKPDLPVINEDYYVNIQSDVYGPYLDHESGEHSVTIAFKKSNIGKTVDTINVHLRVYNERNGNIILSRYFNNLTLSKFVPKTITFNLPIESYLNEFGMKIILDVNSNDGHYSDSFNYILYPYLKDAEYNLNNYAYSSLTLKGNAFSFQNGGLKTYQTKFKFSNFEDYFYIDRYYRLTLNQFTFQSVSQLPFEYEEAKMIILNPPDCFSYLSKDKDGNTVVDLIVENNDGTCSFKLKSGLLVNRKTLEMADYIVDNNYVATNYFYLPHNRLEEVLGTRFKFEIKGVNKQKANFYWYATYNTDHHLLGDCYNSDYCIMGEV